MDTLSIVLISLSLLLSASTLVFLLFTRRKGEQKDLSPYIGELQKELTNINHQAIMELNDRLTMNAKNSDQTITEFRIQVGNQVNEIQSKLEQRFNDQFIKLNETVSSSMNKMNDKVDEKLTSSSKNSQESISEFKMNVNQQLTGFQTKIEDRLKEQFQKLTDDVRKNMDGINEKVDVRLNQGFEKTNETFTNIINRMAIIDKAQANIEGLSQEMIGLQNILSNNQKRGAFGEFQLNQILFGTFGENYKLYQLQYTIREARGKKESVRADAVVFLPEPHHKVCIDSKFPYTSYSALFEGELSKEEEAKLLSSFAQEVKTHINEISGKYVIEGETADYALMFVPSDGILAMLHSHLPAVIEHAKDKRVLIVSPTTLVPLLSSYGAILLEFERNKNAQVIIAQLRALSKEFERFGGEWQSLTKNIQSVTSQSEKVNKRVGRITGKFDQIKSVDLIDDKDEVELLEDAASQEDVFEVVR